MKKFLASLGIVCCLLGLYACVASVHITHKYVLSPMVEYKQSMTQTAEDYVVTKMEEVNIPSMPRAVSVLINQFYGQLHSTADSYINKAAVYLGIALGILLFLGNIFAVLFYTILMHWLVKKVVHQRFSYTVWINTVMMILFNLMSLFAELEIWVIVKFLCMLMVNFGVGALLQKYAKKSRAISKKNAID